MWTIFPSPSQQHKHDVGREEIIISPATTDNDKTTTKRTARAVDVKKRSQKEVKKNDEKEIGKERRAKNTSTNYCSSSY